MEVGANEPYGRWYLFLHYIKRKEDEKLCLYIFIVSGTTKAQAEMEKSRVNFSTFQELEPLLANFNFGYFFIF
jgi:hypothetical protein